MRPVKTAELVKMLRRITDAYADIITSEFGTYRGRGEGERNEDVRAARRLLSRVHKEPDSSSSGKAMSCSACHRKESAL